MLLYFLLSALPTTDAINYYTNSSSSLVPAATTSSQQIVSASTVVLVSNNATSASSVPSWNSIGFYNTKSYWVGQTTKQYPIHHEIVTAQPNATSQIQSLSNVMKCWSSIETWRNESASFQNAKIANRTWSVTSFWSTTQTTFSRSSTIYPTNVSTYTLCDGTPRVNARPKTTHWSGNTSFSGTYTKTLTPTFREQPCSLSPYDCRLLYHDTDAAVKNEDELLNQCGNPAHLEEDPQCILGGGPVELVYFPVESSNNSLCNNRTSGALTARPMMPGLSEITTLGHTFTSASVYLSFKTLFATYDGFWDRVGPDFTDLIVPLHSTDVSTQCGGWGAAYGAGTALNYADLNWPVPASAYSCQDRCSMSYISSASLFPPLNIIGWQLETVSPPEQCNTIWSDVNPVLAVPTKIRGLVPEWSTCSFWNKNIANFWFDPPIALQPADAVVVPTAPSRPHSTPAAAASTPTSPSAPNTRTGSVSTATFPSPTSSTQIILPSSSDAQFDPAATLRVPSEAASSGEGGVYASGSTQTLESSPTASSFIATQDPVPPAPPALSVLTEALSTSQLTADGHAASTSESQGGSPPAVETSVVSSLNVGDIVASIIGLTTKTQPSAGETTDGELQSSIEEGTSSRTPGLALSTSQPAFSYDPVNSQPWPITRSSSDSVVPPTLIPGDLTFTISDQSGAFQTVIVDSQATTQEGLATIFGHTITRGDGGMAIVTGPTAGASSTKQTVLVLDSIPLTASAIPEHTNAVLPGDTTLSFGGPAATISGDTITQASEGLVLIGSDTIATFTAQASPITSSGQTVWAFGSLTITASSDPHYVNGILFNGTSLSYNTGTIVVDGATITAGWGALQISGTDMTEVSRATSKAESNGIVSTESLPPIIVPSSTISVGPTAPTDDSVASSTPTLSASSSCILQPRTATSLALFWTTLAMVSFLTGLT